MKLSPLQLKHYHFTAVTLIARPGIAFDNGAGDIEPYPLMDSEDLKTIISLGEPEDDPDPHEFAVLLSISYDPAKDSSFPYTFAVDVEGAFTFAHEGSVEERKKLVACNGASMLYGAAREVLLSLSARQKYGPLLLPSANFNGLGPNPASEPTRATSPQPHKKKSRK